MQYDLWKSTNVHERMAPPPAPDSAEDVIRLAVPKYSLKVTYDKYTCWTHVTLRILTVPAEGWRVLDECVVKGSSEVHAVACLREQRRRAREYALHYA